MNILAPISTLLILGGIVAGIVALVRHHDSEPSEGLARRVVVGLLTFGMTIVVTVGVGQLLNVIFSAFDNSIGSGTNDAALAIAMLVVGAPSAYALWRYQLRTLPEGDDRSIVWLFHLGAAAATYSIGSIVALSNGLQFDRTGSATSLAYAAAWVAGWFFYERIMRRAPAPEIPGLPHAIGTAAGLVSAVVGTVGLLGAAIDRLVVTDVMAGTRGITDITHPLTWAAVGLAVWLWQRTLTSESDPAGATVTIALGVGGGAALGLGGIATVLYVFLDAIGNTLATDRIGGGVAAAVVGLLVWRYHHLRLHEEGHLRIARHVLSGLSLVALASSVGVLVNVGLSAATPAFAERDTTNLLWGGLAVLAVAVPTWWATWRPATQPDADTATSVRRTYLTLLAGIGGVAGAIAVGVVVFDFVRGLLDGSPFSTIIDDSRAGIGFVVATGLVFVYHYRLWRAGRTETEEVRMALERVTFVGPQSAAADLRRELRVRVTDFRSGGTGRLVPEADLAEYLRTLPSEHALVVSEDGSYRVTRLGEPVGDDAVDAD